MCHSRESGNLDLEIPQVMDSRFRGNDNQNRCEENAILIPQPIHLLRKIDDPARITPFVIVPAEDLDGLPHCHSHKRIENAGVRIVNDVGGNYWVFGIV